MIDPDYVWIFYTFVLLPVGGLAGVVAANFAVEHLERDMTKPQRRN